ncbi:hypothetical protein CRENBAI_006617 [Crenichthys baileyi]|uniref:Uncharacterized protein n=1 Tax=Crenichthys baileyi TaxID=28760 RepID=A0AAV9QN05_9TELE
MDGVHSLTLPILTLYSQVQVPIPHRDRPHYPTTSILNWRGGHYMGTPPQVSFISEKPMKQHPHSASSTHSPALSTPSPSCPHHTGCHNGKARAPHNAPALVHRHNRADTIEHRAHNRTPDPTPRRDKLTRQEVPGQRQELGADVPHTDTPQHCHCNDSPGRNIFQLSSSTAAQPIQIPVIPHPRRGHNPHTLQPPTPPSSPAPRSSPRHKSQQSSTPPSPPNHLASASSPSPSVREREIRPTAPGQPHPTSRPSAGTGHAPPPHPHDHQL